MAGDKGEAPEPGPSSSRRGVRPVLVATAMCKALMDGFIAAHPEIWNEDIGVEQRRDAGAQGAR